MADTFLINGANGYSGRLIAEEAIRRGFSPILAGRSREAIESLAHRLGLGFRVFGCEEARDIARQLEGVRAVLHCAGPFSATHKPMVKACMAAGAHYLDISGEIRSYEKILSQDQAFKDAGIVAIPGVGFDVVPTDCVARLLKERQPGAVRLRLALRIAGGPSPGSFRTLVEGLHAGGLIRKDGRLAPIPPASKISRIRFLDGERDAVIAPWADLSSAWYSTGIPSIETYIAIQPLVVALIRLSGLAGPLFALKPTQSILKAAIRSLVHGPDERERAAQRFEIWAEVEDERCVRETMHVLTPNGYDVTADASLRALSRVLAGRVAPGAYTPAMAFGGRFLYELRGIEVVGEPGRGEGAGEGSGEG